MDHIKQQFLKAVNYLQSGQAASAERILEKLSKKLQDSEAVLYNLGLAQQFQGRHSSAQKSYQKVLRLNPSNIDAAINLAIANKELKQFDAALSLLEKRELNQQPRALNLLGTIKGEQGNTDSAIDIFKQVITYEPNFEEARINLVKAYQSQGDLSSALEALMPLVNVSQSLEHRSLQIELMLEKDQYNEAAPLIRDLMSQYPDALEPKKLHLKVLEYVSASVPMIEMAKDLVEKYPNDAELWNALGWGYYTVDNITEAQLAFNRAVKLGEENPKYINHLGYTYSSQGNKEKAEDCFRRSIALNPVHPEPYRSLVAMKRYQSVDDNDLAAMESLWQDSNYPDEYRQKLAFALGKVYDDCKLYDKAFETYRVGNQLKHLELQVDIDQYVAHIDKIIDTFNQPPKIFNQAEHNITPIFVVGMPRSGTTLVEQILSRHPKVQGLGELPCIEEAVAHLERKYDASRIYPSDFLSIPETDFANEADIYLKWVQQQHQIDSPFILDKMPTNFVHVWLIKAMFPQSVVINCRRHPLDVIVSNYFQLYGSDINFVYSLTDLAKYYVRYYRLTEKWNNIFNIGYTTVHYEKLVTEHEYYAQKLVEDAGLEWDAVCLDPKRTQDKTVRTASIWQVRRGIYTSSKARWRNYKDYLTPAIEILQREQILNSELDYYY